MELPLPAGTATARVPDFNAPAEDFKLALDAVRISYAHCFDPMLALHTSSVEPLPHQINAVYGVMLKQLPLRFLLADDPGAGKTVMAGLFLKELMLRGQAKRVLIVAPGSLVEQWRNELVEKLDVHIPVFAPADKNNANPFITSDLLIARLDQLARNERYLNDLQEVRWDLVIIDEAHKLTASRKGLNVSKTQRYRLGEILGETSEHLLLLSATPHNGKEDDFRLFLSLIDRDRFGTLHPSLPTGTDLTDVVHRTVKEDLQDFTGAPLLPPRHAHTAIYDLSVSEAALYEQVASYIRLEMGRADRLGGRQRETVGFALTLLLRRLTSSPAAIYASLQRRRLRLEHGLANIADPIRSGAASTAHSLSSSSLDDLDEDWDAGSFETASDRLIESATAAIGPEEVKAEIETLLALERAASALLASQTDRKWDELSRLLQTLDQLPDSAGHQRKLIVFTEHRDTLWYLLTQIRVKLGSDSKVVAIHGGMGRTERLLIQETFATDPATKVLVATDAAGEGINLQCASLMVNYDMPWNPNRLEQRFGRIHRIGQKEACHLWSLVAKNTLEGHVFGTLFDKLKSACIDLGGRVFDVLGQAFEDTPLHTLLRDGIRGEVSDRLENAVSETLDTTRLQSLLNRVSPTEVPNFSAVQGNLQAAAENCLSQNFLSSFLHKALSYFGGSMEVSPEGYYRIGNVPAEIREWDSLRGSRYNPVRRRYGRASISATPVCEISPDILHVAHPLVQACAGSVLSRLHMRLKQGAYLSDSSTLAALLIIEHSVYSTSTPSTAISQKVQFIGLEHDGTWVELPWRRVSAMVVNADPPKATPAIRPPLQELSEATVREFEKSHFSQATIARERVADRCRQTLFPLITQEMNAWTSRYLSTQTSDTKVNHGRASTYARRKAEALSARFRLRDNQLIDFVKLESGTPHVLGIAHICRIEEQANDVSSHAVCVDAQARTRIERLAMEAVVRAEHLLGNVVVDVSASKCGWDLTAYSHSPDVHTERHIEVKGRAHGQSTITVTSNEVRYALANPGTFVLAIVIVATDDSTEGPYYIEEPFGQPPDWAEISRTLAIAPLIGRSINPSGNSAKQFKGSHRSAETDFISTDTFSHACRSSHGLSRNDNRGDAEPR